MRKEIELPKKSQDKKFVDEKEIEPRVFKEDLKKCFNFYWSIWTGLDLQ